jgi:hypothetical protein
LPPGHRDNETRGSDRFFGQTLTPMLANINTAFGQKLSQNRGGSLIPARIPNPGGINRNDSVQFLLFQKFPTDSFRDY